jgi:ankyrin repeat protein
MAGELHYISHLASERGQVDVARMLIERGADVTAQNDDGRTPLHLASYRGQVDIARMLIERGADLAAQDNDGDTSLHVVSERGQVDVVHMLIEHGADVTMGGFHYILHRKRDK